MKNINKDDFKSDIIREYLTFKENNPNFIILYQIGAFFESYFEDAINFASSNNLTLTTKKVNSKEIPMAGVSAKTIDIHIKKLLDNNYKVCLCEQFKDENDNFIRKITRKYTKGTILEKEFLNSAENNFIASIDLTKNMASLSYADVSTGQFYKTEAKKEDIIEEIFKINPSEILVLNNQKEETKFLKESFNLTYIDNTTFSNTQNAIISYCKDNFINFCPSFDKIICYDINNFMFMNNVTRHHLELLRRKRDLKKKGSLLDFLNYTKTPMGIRKLKQYITAPLLDLNLILKRQEAIEELILDNNLIENFEKNLEYFTDLSRLCAKIANSTIKAKELYLIASTIEKIENLILINKNTKSELLKLNSSILEEIFDFSKEIKNAINENYKENENDEFLIKENYNPQLDYLRNNLRIEKQKIETYQEKLRKKLETTRLEIKYFKEKGYLIEIDNNVLIDEDFILFQLLKTSSRYKTKELKELENAVDSLKFKIFEFEKDIFNNVKKQALNYVEDIRKLSSTIAQIDAIVSLARCAIEYNLTKPTITKEDFEIKGAIHPNLLKQNVEITRNDTSLKENDIIILTGANMSGKSTYLKHNAIVAILSQMGAFTPATSAKVSIVDKLFFYQGSTDDITNNASSFMIEMRDLKYILDNATKKSLILLDEPAKSTNSKESGAIVKSFIEYILKYYKTKSIITTHNLDITELEEKYPNQIFNYHLGENSFKDRKIKRGVAKNSSAITTAKIVNLPKELIETAESYLK